jgi:hypothetical protein
MNIIILKLLKIKREVDGKRAAKTMKSIDVRFVKRLKFKGGLSCLQGNKGVILKA